MHPVGAGLKKTQRKAFFVSPRVFFRASWWACGLVCVYFREWSFFISYAYTLYGPAHIYAPYSHSHKFQKKLIEHGLIVSILLNNFTVYQTVNISGCECIASNRLLSFFVNQHVPPVIVFAQKLELEKRMGYFGDSFRLLLLYLIRIS